MIVVTGGAGFIGSVFIWKLNTEGITDIIVVDSLGSSNKWKNLVKRRFTDYFHKDKFLEMVTTENIPFKIDAIVHMGACTSTTERNADYLIENNYRYSRILAEFALKKDIRFIYASSAATYGDGSFGFSDDDEITKKLQPLNMYAYSKHLFDLWVLNSGASEKVVGLKFFNVFGPNEYHKGDMASLVYKSYIRIKQTGTARLFKSNTSEYKDGEQKRDFIYVKDCVSVMWWILQRKEIAGIFNLGTGKARSWNDLVKSVFSALNLTPKIEYIDMPESIQKSYQNFTEADMNKLKSTGCPLSFYSLEEAVRDYVINYLEKSDPYL